MCSVTLTEVPKQSYISKVILHIKQNGTQFFVTNAKNLYSNSSETIN
jgi:hypothetical protein